MSMPASKFDDFLKAKQEPKEEEPENREKKPVKAKPEPKPAPVIVPAAEAPRPVGRPRTGKRSNPDYRNTTVYIDKNLHADIDEWLRRQRREGESDKDFSDLVQELLEQWAKKNLG